LRLLVAGFAALLPLVFGPAAVAKEEAQEALVLATTTSARDSGLFDALIPLFQERTGIAVRVVAVGSGAALRMGADGNADVLVTHAPEGEKGLVDRGLLIDRQPFMENYFVLAGPADDPVGVRQARSAADALRRIAEARAPFVSRGDDSGTHRREVALFRSAGLDPEAEWEGLTRTGSGMGLALQVAGERRAYVLSDVGTFRAFRDRISLADLSRPEPALRNLYSVMRPNPERFPAGTLRVEAAKRFAEFLLSSDVQERITAFGTDGSQGPLFSPLSAKPEPEGQAR
jgi:tungstate transport system substrate-binding protein